MPGSSLVASFGEVTDDSPLTVRFVGTEAADAVEVGKNDDYTPTVGDTVWLVLIGTAWVAWGSFT